MYSDRRRSELSIMNVLLCLFVIFIHAASSTISTADKASPKFALIFIIWRLCSCAVSGFVFLAGLKLSLGLEKPFSYPKYLLGRLKRVVLPYLIAAAVYALYFSYMNYAAYTPKSFFAELFTGSITAHFYFVIMIVQFYITAPLWRWIIKRLDSGIKTALFLIVSYFVSQLFGQYLAEIIAVLSPGKSFIYSDRIFTTYLFWWSLGLVIGRCYETLRIEAKRGFFPLALLFLLAGALDSGLAYLNTSRGLGLWWLETAHTFYIFAAICFLFALGIKLSETALPKLLSPLDKISYSVYLWHPLLLYFADSLAYRLSAGMAVKLFIRLGYGYILTIALCLIPYALKLIIRRANASKASSE